MLLHLIHCSLSMDKGMLPQSVSSLSLSQIYLLDELYKMAEDGRGTLSLSALARESGFSKATVCAALKGLRR